MLLSIPKKVFTLGVRDDINPTNRSVDTFTFAGNTGTPIRDIGTQSGTAALGTTTDIGTTSIDLTVTRVDRTGLSGSVTLNSNTSQSVTDSGVTLGTATRAEVRAAGDSAAQTHTLTHTTGTQSFPQTGRSDTVVTATTTGGGSASPRLNFSEQTLGQGATVNNQAFTLGGVQRAIAMTTTTSVPAANVFSGTWTLTTGTAFPAGTTIGTLPAGITFNFNAARNGGTWSRTDGGQNFVQPTITLPSTTSYAITSGGVVDTANGWTPNTAPSISGNTLTIPRITRTALFSYSFTRAADITGGTITGTTTSTTDTSRTVGISDATQTDGAIQYTLSDFPSGSDIDFVVDGVTLTEAIGNRSHTFNDTDATRTWSMTGTVRDASGDIIDRFTFSQGTTNLLTNVNFAGSSDANTMATFFAGQVNALANFEATAVGDVVTVRFRGTNTDTITATVEQRSGDASVTSTQGVRLGDSFVRYEWRVIDDSGTQLTSGDYEPNGITDSAETIVTELAQDIMAGNTGWTLSAVTPEAGHQVIHIETNSSDNVSLEVDVIPRDSANFALNEGLGNEFEGNGQTAATVTVTAPASTGLNPGAGGMHLITALSNETFGDLITRVANVISNDAETPDWTAVEVADGANRNITLTADLAGSHDGLWTFVYTDGSGTAGDITFSNVAVTTEGTDFTWETTFRDPVTGVAMTDNIRGSGLTNTAIATEVATELDNLDGWSASSTGTVVTVTRDTDGFVPSYTRGLEIAAGATPPDTAVPDAMGQFPWFYQDVIITDRTFNLVNDSTAVVTEASDLTFPEVEVTQGRPAIGPTVITLIYSGNPPQTLTLPENIAAEPIVDNLVPRINLLSGVNATDMGTTLALTLTSAAARLTPPIVRWDDYTSNARVQAIGVPDAGPLDTTRGLLAFTRDNSQGAQETDEERPWARNVFNLSSDFIISYSENNHLFVNDITYEFNGTPYESYVERRDLPLSEMTDGRNVKGLSEVLIMGEGPGVTLNINMDLTNTPGSAAGLETGSVTGSGGYAFTFVNDYKTELRENGRMLNYRITDRTTDTAANNLRWRIAGIELVAAMGGIR